jgi:GST-like protein
LDAAFSIPQALIPSRPHVLLGNGDGIGIGYVVPGKELLMIDLYTWSSPNGFMVQIVLEETGLEYELHPVNLSKGEQKTPEFLAINPNGKIPAITDRDGPSGNEATIFESGAILLYLGEKSGKFLPRDPSGRWRVISWLMFQMAGIGPSLAQAVYFVNRAPEPVPHAVERFVTEAKRFYGVVDRRLAETEFLAGDYSIADIACFPWMRNHQRFGVDVADHPNVTRWLRTISERPVVRRALDQN